MTEHVPTLDAIRDWMRTLDTRFSQPSDTPILPAFDRFIAARDAEKWQEGVDALALSTLPDAPPLVNPYRVTPTEEPKP